MVDKITLTNLANLQNENTAISTINNNNTATTAAMNNTLSRDGTSPNQMGASIDMNSNHILNLPSPNSSNEPIRFQDLTTLQAGGTVTTLPVGGTTGQTLQKNSNTNYDVKWGGNVTSVGLVLPSDFTVTGSPVTTAGTLTATLANTPTGTGGLVRQSSPTLTGTVTVNGSTIDTSGNIAAPSVKITGTAGAGYVEYPAESSAPSAPAAGLRMYADSSGRKSWVRASDGFSRSLDSVLTANRVYTLQDSSDTIVGRATTDTLTNKSISGSTNILSNIANASLTNSSVSVAGTSIALGGSGGLSTASNILGSNVLLNNTSNFFDGPSMAQGSTGTWFVVGTLTLVSTTSDQFQVKLWDGTTVISGTETSNVANQVVSVSLAGFITSPVGNIRLSVKDISTANGSINTTAITNASTIFGIRIG